MRHHTPCSHHISCISSSLSLISSHPSLSLFYHSLFCSPLAWGFDNWSIPWEVLKATVTCPYVSPPFCHYLLVPKVVDLSHVVDTSKTWQRLGNPRPMLLLLCLLLPGAIHFLQPLMFHCQHVPTDPNKLHNNKVAG